MKNYKAWIAYVEALPLGSIFSGLPFMHSCIHLTTVSYKLKVLHPPETAILETGLNQSCFLVHKHLCHSRQLRTRTNSDSIYNQDLF